MVWASRCESAYAPEVDSFSLDMRSRQWPLVCVSLKAIGARAARRGAERASGEALRRGWHRARRFVLRQKQNANLWCT